MISSDPYQAALDRAIVADRSLRGTIALTGRDRLTLLHNLLTNDIAALSPGTGCYAAYLTPQGRMIADMRVAVLEDRVLLDVEPAVRAEMLDRLDSSIFAEDVRVADQTGSLAVVRVAGPQAALAIASAFGVMAAGHHEIDEELVALAEHASRESPFRQGTVVVVRDDSLGIMGFDILIAREHGAELVRACEAVGAVSVQESTLEVLRVEAGRPRFGIDMDRDTIPLEAGIESRAISFSKGCYPGQEVIIRVLHRGHGRVARRLVGLTIDADVGPDRGDSIMLGAQAIGRVTSTVWSPAVGKPIALGYVQRDASEPGTSVSVEHGGVGLPALISPLPFRS